MKAQPGVTLPELVLVAWLFGLVLLAAARFATAQGRLLALSHDRIRAVDVSRTVALVLDGELRHLAAVDVGISADSVRLRAVRGTGVACHREGAVVTVRYRGIRQPDPRKDSVLVVTEAGTVGAAHDVTAVGSGDPGCGPGLRLTLDPAPSRAGLLLVFETGSYHLTDAFRYRTGRGGRQPITEGVLDDGRFQRGPAGLEARFALHPDSLPRAGDRTPTITVGLLNPWGLP